MRIPALLVATIAACLVYSPPAHSEQAYDGNYFCTEEMAGGLAWDKAKKRWRNALFQTSSRFVVSLKRKGTKKALLSKEEDRPTFAVNMRKHGDKNSQTCVGDDHLPEVTVYSGGFLFCQSALTRYAFNLQNLRFTSSYQYGYIDGKDNNDNTPSMTGGTCSKID